MAASHSVDPDDWMVIFHEPMARVAGRSRPTRGLHSSSCGTIPAAVSCHGRAFIEAGHEWPRVRRLPAYAPGLSPVKEIWSALMAGPPKPCMAGIPLFLAPRPLWLNWPRQYVSPEENLAFPRRAGGMGPRCSTVTSRRP